MSKRRSEASYRSFVLRIGHDPQGYYARGDSLTGQQGEARLQLDDLLAKAPAVGEWMVRGRNMTPPEPLPLREAWQAQARELGKELGKRIFTGDVLRCFEDSRSAAERSGQKLCIRLRLDDLPELLQFPWELMEERHQRLPMAISVETPLARYPTVPVAVDREGSRAPSLSILVAVATPCGFAELDIEQEIKQLRSALATSLRWREIRFEVLARATPEKLRQRIKEFSVLHFIGHGELREGLEGCLVFEGENREPELVDGRRLAAVLGLDRPSVGSTLRLVVLNACKGAATLPSDAFGGVAQRLIEQGLPAAVAMREAIADRDAIAFASSFYDVLAGGAPIELAISRARHSLYADRSSLAWLAPLLFLRTGDGPLFRRSRLSWKAKLLAAGLTALTALGVWGLWQQISTPPPQPPVRPVVSMTDDPECPSPPGLSLGLTLIAPGTFSMGSERYSEEAPVHTVTISEPFCIGRTEVTEAQWEAVMGDAPKRQALLSSSIDGHLPKQYVSWEDVLDFMRRLDELARQKAFSPPSEAQWEYAARAGSAGAYSFGDDVSALHKYANCGPKSADGYGNVAPVSMFEPNAWGLYDMQGNVTEWVADFYGSYGPGPDVAPAGPSIGGRRIRRGGSYGSTPDNCRVAARTESKTGWRSRYYGLRIARKAVVPGAGR